MLVDPKWAIIAVIFASAFGVGSMMLIFYTDIKNIPIDLYEAAAIDGAGPAASVLQHYVANDHPDHPVQSHHVNHQSFQQVTLVMLLTNGGPMKSTYFYGLMTYNNAFKFHKLGYASANAWVMFIIILLLSALVFKSSDTWVFYESTANKNKAKKGKKAKGKEVAR